VTSLRSGSSPLLWFALIAGAALTSAPAHATDLSGTPTDVARLACTAHVGSGVLSCLPVAGSQVSAVGLAARPGATDPGVWSADVAIHNGSASLLGGGTDGRPATGVEVRLADAPRTTSGLGSVRAAHIPTRYSGGLTPGATSASQTWRFEVDPYVDAFTFQVALVAVVTPPGGWVALSSTTASVFASGTQQITATARAANGAALPGAFLSWSTGDAGIATVDATGLITGVATGATTVTARRGSTSGTVTVTVCPDLAVGGVYHTTFTDGSRLCLGGYTGAEYTVIPTNQSTTSSISLTTTASGIVGVTGPPTPFTEAPEDGRRAELGLDGTAVYPGDEAGVTLAERQAAAASEYERVVRDHEETTPLLRRADTRITPNAPASIIPPGVPTVGASWTLNVAQGCSGAVDNRVGTVRNVSTRAIIVSDDNNPAGGFTQVQYDSLAARFDRIVWRSVTAFGEPTDLDANGRVVLFYTRAVNELSPPASSLSANGFGYFTTRDLFSSAPTSCERSNEGEILYMLVPDPTGAVNSNVRTVSQVEGGTTRQAGREMSRLINASRRLYVTGSSSFEEAWLEIGMAGMAEELMFYNTSVGLTPRQNIVVTVLTTGPNASRRVAAFNTYANMNYGRLRQFLNRPDIRFPFTNVTSTSQTDIDGNAGATWAFLRYAADRRGGNESEFWAALVGTTESREGLDNIRNALGLATEAELMTWFRDWNVAMYADDAVAGIPTIYQTTSWHYRSIYGALNGSYQLIPRPLTNNTGLTLNYARGGTSAFLRFGVPADGAATFTTASAASPLSYPVSVVRTK